MSKDQAAALALQAPTPSNLEAEQAVLGGILNRPERFPDVARIVAPSDFFSASHRSIFQALLALHEDGAPLDLVTLGDHLKRGKSLGNVGGPGYLEDLAEAAILGCIHVEHHARMVREQAIRRQLQAGALSLARMAVSPGTPLEEILDVAGRMALAAPGNGTPASCFGDLDLPSVCADTLLNQEPEPVAWLLQDSMLQGSLGFLCADGGTGKSWLALQLAASVATGLDALDGVFRVAQRGPVFAVFGEDTKPVVHHRVRAVFREYGTEADGDAHAQDLFLVPGAGLDLRLVEQDQKGNLQPSRTYEELHRLLTSIKDLRLVILDPLARFYAGPENDNAGATFFCALLEQLAKDTGAAVLITHHSNKASRGSDRSSYDFLHQGSMRGASGFTNAARWQCNLTGLAKAEVAKIGGDGQRPGSYLTGMVVKKNMGPPEERFHLQRVQGGVLRAFQAEDTEAEARKELTLRLHRVVAQNEGRYTPRTLAKELAGTCGFGRERVRGILEDMVERKILSTVTRLSGNKQEHEYLTTGGNSE